ncbi:MAG: kelch repeat-containing protein [Terriglobia bacterium]
MGVTTIESFTQASLIRNAGGCVLNRLAGITLCVLTAALSLESANLPPNRWVELRKDATGARRSSAIRYAPGERAFFLWGFMNDNYELLQEFPLMEVPEYDMVSFDPAKAAWRNHLPSERQELWSAKLPLAFIPRTYAGITSGSERSLLRSPTDDAEGVPRPDLNIVYDQVTYDPDLKALFYFTGGLTAAYRVADRRWVDLEPNHSPPPVLGGSLAFDPIHHEILLFGGGHVAERSAQGKTVGYTGMWSFNATDRDWRRLPLDREPPPRMNTRMVCDTKNQVLILFGGDGQSHYLADTWIFDLKTRQWRESKARSGPPARAGHFTVYDPSSGWVIVGGGHNLRDLTDLWAFDAAEDRWWKLEGDVPTGFYITADIAPEQGLIVLVTNTQKPGDTTACNTLYPVRTTYGFRLDAKTLARSEVRGGRQSAIPKRTPSDHLGVTSDAQKAAQAARLANLPENRWVLLDSPGLAAPTRTWGSATFDTDRSQILYWGGGHCGYGGSDVEGYDVAAHTWRSLDLVPEFPERAWDKGVRLAGVTFRGAPWTEHGRKIYAYDPVSRKMVMMRRIRLTSGYDPEALRDFPSRSEAAADALFNPPSSYVKYTTFTFDPEVGEWELLGPAPVGADTLATTPQGVVGLHVDWPTRLDDAGYLLPWRPWHPKQDAALYLLSVADRRWSRLDNGGDAPQNLYEQTSLVYDSKRDRLLLHGAGVNRDELWAFDLRARRWDNLRPRVAPAGDHPPPASREAVYLPDDDVVLTAGSTREGSERPACWAYRGGENLWRKVEIPMPSNVAPGQLAGQNRALVYDPKRKLVFLVLGERGDDGKASVYALRYRDAGAH